MALDKQDRQILADALEIDPITKAAADKEADENEARAIRAAASKTAATEAMADFPANGSARDYQAWIDSHYLTAGYGNLIKQARAYFKANPNA